MENQYTDLDQLKDRLNHLRQNHSDKVAKAFDIETAQTENNKQPFIDLITDNVRETMKRIIKVSEN